MASEAPELVIALVVIVSMPVVDHLNAALIVKSVHRCKYQAWPFLLLSTTVSVGGIPRIEQRTQMRHCSRIGIEFPFDHAIDDRVLDGVLDERSGEAFANGRFHCAPALALASSLAFASACSTCATHLCKAAKRWNANSTSCAASAANCCLAFTSSAARTTRAREACKDPSVSLIFSAMAAASNSGLGLAMASATSPARRLRLWIAFVRLDQVSLCVSKTSSTSEIVGRNFCLVVSSRHALSRAR